MVTAHDNYIALKLLKYALNVVVLLHSEVAKHVYFVTLCHYAIPIMDDKLVGLLGRHVS